MELGQRVRQDFGDPGYSEFGYIIWRNDTSIFVIDECELVDNDILPAHGEYAVKLYAYKKENCYWKDGVLHCV